MRCSVLALVVLFGSLSCATKSEPAAPVAPRESSGTEYADWDPPPMEVHYQKALQVHDAVVMGDLAVAQATAKWIAENTVKEDLSVAWRGKVPPVVTAANDIVSATDAASAARATAQLGQACGSCHSEMGVDLEAPTEEMPPEGEGTTAHMKRHQWAVGRMWHGLIAPSDGAWNEGAAAMMEAPLDVVSDEAEAQKEGQGLADQVHGLAAAAQKQTQPEERAATYGELLSTCSSCHTGET